MDVSPTFFSAYVPEPDRLLAPPLLVITYGVIVAYTFDSTACLFWALAIAGTSVAVASWERRKATRERQMPGWWRGCHSRRCDRGFTLLEFSIVLVIIGLIVGVILTGQDLINAARVRAQIKQIQAYQIAVNSFQAKYGCLPGDCPSKTASAFGFTARGLYAGEGDGNGVIEGAGQDGPGWSGAYQERGETVVFWRDLSFTNFIESDFHTALENSLGVSPITATGSPNISAFLPQAKIGSNYVYVCEGNSPYGITGTNYYGIAPVTSIGGGAGEEIYSNGPGMTVQQAFAIDSKMDDGLPASGLVMAAYENFNAVTSQFLFGAHGGLGQGQQFGILQAAGTATTCYDNGNVGGVPWYYSMEQNGGSGMNCAIIVQFQ